MNLCLGGVVPERLLAAIDAAVAAERQPVPRGVNERWLLASNLRLFAHSSEDSADHLQSATALRNCDA